MTKSDDFFKLWIIFVGWTQKLYPNADVIYIDGATKAEIKVTNGTRLNIIIFLIVLILKSVESLYKTAMNF